MFNDATERSLAVTVALTVCITLPREPAVIGDQSLVCNDLQVVVALTELLKVSVVFSGHLSFNKITED